MRLTKAKKRGLIVVATMAILLAAILIFWINVYQPWAERQKRPLLFVEEIASASEDYQLDPYLVTAMVFCESSFRTEIISHADAVGLMQVTPATGEWIAPKVGITDFEEEMLKEPEINLKLGCWYIGWLMDRYDGRVAEALTAYIAGQGDVDRWLADPAFSDDGKTLNLNDLKGSDTRNYARKILSAREDYIRLYPGVYPKDVLIKYPLPTENK